MIEIFLHPQKVQLKAKNQNQVRVIVDQRIRESSKKMAKIVSPETRETLSLFDAVHFYAQQYQWRIGDQLQNTKTRRL